MRTYYCFQMGSPTYPTGEIVVTTRRPQSMEGVRKIRLTSVALARERYEREWNEECEASLQEEERRAWQAIAQADGKDHR